MTSKKLLNLYNDALFIVVNAFRYKVDRGGNPYIIHLLEVERKISYYSYPVRIVALLHDLLEDCGEDYTYECIKHYFGDDIADAILILTRKQGECYNSYIERISKNRIACVVKIADLEHNMDLSRLEKVTNSDDERYNKYKKAKAKTLRSCKKT
jgi:(p)ppGpp synthase/HD superfamily hydrolase